MQRILGRVLGWAAAPFLAVAVAAFAMELARALWMRWNGFHDLLHPAVLALGGGLLGRVLAARALARFGREDPLEFIDTLEHELTHALMGYLTFSPPVSLSASLKGGGEVELKGSNPLAALAPYFLPFWCLLAVGLGLLIRPSAQGAWNLLVFFLLGVFAYRLGREYRWRQTDLHVYGFTFSTLSVALLLLLAVGVILHARGLLPWNWMARALPEAGSLMKGAWETVRGILAGNSSRP